MHQITENYPETIPHLERLPEHIVDHLGDVALQLQYEPLSPRTDGGELRFDQAINSPLLDSEQLATDADEAIARGNEKVGQVLLGGSELLATAYASLEQAGIRFGAPDIETDVTRDTRELQERSIIYKAACSEAVARAVSAKQNDAPEAVASTLESLILLRYLRDRSDDGGYAKPDGYRAELRDAVRQGLGSDLLAATVASQKLMVGTGYERVADAMHAAVPLLSLSTGKRVDYGFEIQSGEPSLTALPTDRETLRDVLAVMATPYAATKPEAILAASSGLTFFVELKKHYRPDAPPGEPGSFQYLDEVFGKEVPWKEVRDILKATNPLAVVDGMQQLELSDSSVISMFGRRVDPEQPMPYPYTIDTQLIQDMAQLKTSHPKQFALLADKPHQFGDRQADGASSLGYQPQTVLQGIEALLAAGFDDVATLNLATKTPDMDAFITATQEISQGCKQLGIALPELPELADQATMSVAELWDSAEITPDTLSTKLEDMLCWAETNAALSEHFTAMVGPIPNKLPRFDSRRLERLQDQVANLGLPDEVAVAMVTAWSTYRAEVVEITKHRDRGETYDTLSSQDIPSIKHNQLKAYQAELGAITEFTKQYGIETTKDIMREFGIYHFNRHAPAKLQDQYQRWIKGEPVQTAVVEARSDWNSYVGHQPTFTEETGEGVFYFEANSATDTARIAVNIGKHERQAGRQPGTNRFIIHAHADGSGLLMGVNQEEISTTMYRQAASSAQKIGAREVNDFKRHLGPNFEVVLQGCSTAAKLEGEQNIAERISSGHDVRVTGSTTIITGLSIHNDGSVSFASTEAGHQKVVYDAV